MCLYYTFTRWFRSVSEFRVERSLVDHSVGESPCYATMRTWVQIPSTPVERPIHVHLWPQWWGVGWGGSGRTSAVLSTSLVEDSKGNKVEELWKTTPNALWQRVLTCTYMCMVHTHNTPPPKSVKAVNQTRASACTYSLCRTAGKIWGRTYASANAEVWISNK